MKNPVFRKIVCSFAVLTSFWLLVPSAMAIGIRPLRNEFSLAPGESASGEVIVVNETDKDFIAEPIIRVFYKNNDSGLPIYLSKEEQEKQNKIEDFASWIDIAHDQIPVPAKSEAKVAYTIRVPRNAREGGKYATIAFQPVMEPTEGVMVNVRAASLLSVNVERSKGDIVRTGELINFGLPETPTTKEPFAFHVTFLNTGNTHLKPLGWIEMTNLTTGKKLNKLGSYTDPKTGQVIISEAIPVNVRQSWVLPASSRTFEVKCGRGLKNGKYRASLNLTYAEEAPAIQESLDFEVEDGSVPFATSSFINSETLNRSKFYLGLILLGILIIAVGIIIRNCRKKK